MAKTVKTEEQWRKELPPEQYQVLRQKGTEHAFTGAYNEFKGDGVFCCAGCGTPLFDSASKYNSGSGWPSFFAPAAEAGIEAHRDTTHGMDRTEVTCGNCGGHLGHLFPDGPRPTGQRYCINSLSLRFAERGKKEPGC